MNVSVLNRILPAALFLPVMLGPGRGALAQTTERPIVNIVASDHHAAEAEQNVGVFTVSRTGATEASLLVFFQLSGTARNGVDYQELPHSVAIPAGATSIPITVKPINDSLAEGTETVVATLVPSPTLSPVEPYRVGFPASDVILLADNDTPPTNQPPHVVIITPIDGALFTTPTNLVLGANATDDDGEVVSVEFFAGDHFIARAEGPLSTPMGSWVAHWTNPPAGEYTIFARATDNSGATGASRPIHIAVRSAEVPPIPLVTKGSSWRYLDNGSDQGTSWREPGFIDSEWKSGPAQLGFGDGDEATVLRAGNEERRFVTYYFRRAFEISNADGISSLTLRLLRDDGAIVYLNGHVVFRSNMPDGQISFNTLALQAVGADGENVFHSAVIDPKLLVNGRNVLAVEVHQISTESTDLSFDLELAAGPGNSVPVVKLAQPAGGTTFAAPATIAIAVEVRDPDGWVGLVEFFANERKIGEQIVNFIREPDPGQWQSFSFEWKEVPSGEYVLVARATDNRASQSASDQVRVRVGEATPPVPVVTIFARDALAREGTNSSGELNTAAFVVRRTGDTNAGLTVLFSVHGTAVNGVDYAALPSSVTIPAGHHTARMVVTPIRDEQKEPVETVLLALEPDPSLGPIARSTIGEPSRAAAAIADSDQPPPTDLRTADGLFHFSLPGENGSSFRLECSTDLNHWLPLCTTVVTDGAIHFVDPNADRHALRFYRVLPATNMDLDD